MSSPERSLFGSGVGQSDITNRDSQSEAPASHGLAQRACADSSTPYSHTTMGSPTVAASGLGSLSSPSVNIRLRLRPPMYARSRLFEDCESIATLVRNAGYASFDDDSTDLRAELGGV